MTLGAVPPRLPTSTSPKKEQFPRLHGSTNHPSLGYKNNCTERDSNPRLKQTLNECMGSFNSTPKLSVH